ncbi:MAG: protein-export chaperone SecB [Magnetococcales bacterium]|nr:protein-export chaperone SecB [Magnetococcales bacterium]
MTDKHPSATDANAAGAAPPAFHVEKLYLKDLSFESPNAPAAFRDSAEPQVSFNLEMGSVQKGPEHYETTLHVTVKVTAAERVLFLVELTYAGLFLLRNVPQDLLAPTLSVDCPTILFPYVRQLVSEMIIQGGFRPLVLDPINFAALYQQSLQKKAAAQAG